MTNRGPLIIAIVLLLLPVIYVICYLALVDPHGNHLPLVGSGPFFTHYRFGRNHSAQIFWSLERIDRTLRPETWYDPPQLPDFQPANLGP
ncbi:hypothetical protein ETAA8_01810 [Anatilimnocola aggregata]|uniref:Uncharacterized protein n=1 Tax=Anatilimnocola aggregata TaxID=2528021 RepID=A0A517Y4K7_9BACT|nr:hypothetical protein ETAA8_01810 [Anatilimnocola aggregata]